MAEGGSGIWTPGGERPIGQQPEAPQETREISPEELMELMKQLQIAEFLLSNLSTLTQLAYVKLDRSSRDLPQARLAIEAIRVVLPVLEGSVPDQVVRDFGQVLSNLQLAYAGAVDEEQGRPDETSGGSRPPEPSG